MRTAPPIGVGKGGSKVKASPRGGGIHQVKDPPVEGLRGGIEVLK